MLLDFLKNEYNCSLFQAMNYQTITDANMHLHNAFFSGTQVTTDSSKIYDSFGGSCLLKYTRSCLM